VLYEFFVDISLTNAERHTPYNNNNNNITYMVIFLQFSPVRDIVSINVCDILENKPAAQTVEINTIYYFGIISLRINSRDV